jgi:hypothetical protein
MLISPYFLCLPPSLNIINISSFWLITIIHTQPFAQRISIARDSFIQSLLVTQPHTSSDPLPLVAFQAFLISCISETCSSATVNSSANMSDPVAQRWAAIAARRLCRDRPLPPHTGVLRVGDEAADPTEPGSPPAPASSHESSARVTSVERVTGWLTDTEEASNLGDPTAGGQENINMAATDTVGSQGELQLEREALNSHPGPQVVSGNIPSQPADRRALERPNSENAGRGKRPPIIPPLNTDQPHDVLRYPPPATNQTVQMPSSSGSAWLSNDPDKRREISNAQERQNITQEGNTSTPHIPANQTGGANASNTNSSPTQLPSRPGTSGQAEAYFDQEHGNLTGGEPPSDGTLRALSDAANRGNGPVEHTGEFPVEIMMTCY